MKRIKIFKCSNHSYDEYDIRKILNESDWEEVTDEEYTLLNKYSHYENYIIVADETKNTKIIIQDILKKYGEHEKQEQERQRKHIEKQKKLDATKEQRKIERAKKILENAGVKIK